MAARRQRRLAHRSRRPRSRSSTRPTPPRSTGTCTPSATASRKSTPALQTDCPARPSQERLRLQLQPTASRAPAEYAAAARSETPAFQSHSPTKAPPSTKRNWTRLSTATSAHAPSSQRRPTEAEQHSREVCGYSEIDYERNKASRLSSHVEQKLDPEAVLRQLDQFEAQARARGIARTAFRRLTEVFGLNGKQRPDLRALLLSSRPEQYEAPLRRIPAEVSGLGVSGEA